MVIGKNNGAGGSRHFRLGQNANFDFVIGDYGATNTAGTWLESFKMSYLAPADSLKVSSDGRIDIKNRLVMTGSDPTIIFKDTDQRSGFIHMNSSVMYFLNGAGNGSETWQQQGGHN